MSKILKNTTVSIIDIPDTGISIPATPGTYVIPEQDYLLWAASVDIVAKVNSGDIIVNTGTVDLSATAGLRYLSYSERANVSLNGSVITNAISSLDIQGDATAVDVGSGRVNIVVGQTGTPVGKLYTVQGFGTGTTADKWLNVEHPSSTSLTNPLIVPGGGNAVSITYSNSNNSSETDVKIYKNGSLAYTWQVRNKRVAWKILNAGLFSVAQGDRISIYVKKVTGTDPKDPLVVISMMMTSFADADSGIENGL